jgi:hypothetical protein
MSLKAPELGVLLLVALKLGYDLMSLRREPRLREDGEAQARAPRLPAIGRRNAP